jgi:hypothetical protein
MKPKNSVTHEDESIIELTIKSDHKTIATWAATVLSVFCHILTNTYHHLRVILNEVKISIP